MLRIFIFTAAITAFAIMANAQSANDCPTMPSGYACVSVDSIRNALADAEKVKALEAEINTLKDAVLKQREAAVDVRVELAKTIGQLTATQAEIIACRSVNEVLIRQTRNKRVGFINIF